MSKVLTPRHGRILIGGVGKGVLKGERGQKKGQYEMVYCFTPASLSDCYIPEVDRISDEFKQVIKQFPKEIDDKFNSMIVKDGFTDYAPLVGDGS